MKKITVLAALVVITITACRKEEIKPTILNPKSKVLNCRTCEGQWDLKDSIP